MKNYTIENATAEYTGGSIYIYHGQLENGLFFRACDEWDLISICDADTSTEEAEYGEFYDEHETESLSGYQYEKFFNTMLLWIMHNKPDGNYSADELENRMIRRIETDIVIENAQTLAKTIQEETKQEKFNTMIQHQLDSIKRCMAEYSNGCAFVFDKSDYYRRDFEKVWKEEFFNNATRLFENKGYRIVKRGNHTMIEW